MRFARGFLALVVVIFGTLPLPAQEPPKPGPEHAVLKQLEGTWDSTLKAGGMDATGTVSYKMDLGGLWLTGAMESALFGQKFSGRSFESYDAVKKKYVSVWMDSMSTSPVAMEGTYNKETKLMEMSGTGPGMDGAATKYRSVTKFSSSDLIEMTMWIGDGKEPAFTVVYKRKK